MHTRAQPAALLLLAATAVVVGCSVLQSSQECPGDGCSDELRSLAASAADLAPVTEVTRVWRASGLDNGVNGGVDVRAEVADRAAAEVLAHELAHAYAASDVEPVFRVYVSVVPITGARPGERDGYSFVIPVDNGR
jgi:hypothetical protein